MAQGVVSVFREPVPDLTTFVTGELFLGQPRLSSAQFEVVRAAGHVLGPDAYHDAARIAGDRRIARYWREMEDMEPVTRLTLECGQGSGKDFMIAVSFAWIGFQLLHLRSPAGYYGLARTSRIHLLNVAASEYQAARSFFSQLSGALRASPRFTAWFASRPQHELAGIGASLVRFGAGVEAISGHSGIGKLEGLNLLAIAGDEVDEFETQRWLEMGIGSSASRFGTRRKVISMGWPRYPNSPIQAARRGGPQRRPQPQGAGPPAVLEDQPVGQRGHV